MSSISYALRASSMFSRYIAQQGFLSKVNPVFAPTQNVRFLASLNKPSGTNTLIADPRILLNYLQNYAEAGDYKNYWARLAIESQYAKVAWQVVSHHGLMGFIGNGYLRIRAEELGVEIDNALLRQINLDLMSRDLAYRLAHSNSGHFASALNLPIQDIIKSHVVSFEAAGLDAKAWTPYIPMAYFIERQDIKNAEKIFKHFLMFDEQNAMNGLINSTSIIGANVLSSVFSNRYDDGMAWTLKVSKLASQYYLKQSQSK